MSKTICECRILARFQRLAQGGDGQVQQGVHLRHPLRQQAARPVADETGRGEQPVEVVVAQGGRVERPDEVRDAGIDHDRPRLDGGRQVHGICGAQSVLCSENCGQVGGAYINGPQIETREQPR